MKSILIDCLGLLQQNLENKQLKIETAIPDLLEIYADPNHIRLILRNLISNAIKFSYTEHTIYIKAEYNLNSTVVSVRDTGTGMDEATTNNIFDAMQLNSQYGTANEKGTFSIEKIVLKTHNYSDILVTQNIVEQMISQIFLLKDLLFNNPSLQYLHFTRFMQAILKFEK